MADTISSSKLKLIATNEIGDKALKKRLSTLGAPPLDTLLREAGVVLEDRLRSVSGLKEDGVRLVDEALAPDKKRLILSLHPGEQDGFRMLYRGAMQAIRNPPMHKLIDFSVQRAITLLRLIDSLLLLLPESDPADEAHEFLKKVKKYKSSPNEAMRTVLSTMQGIINGSSRLHLGYESVTANLYWLDNDGHKRRFFALNAKNGTARVWTDYLRNSGYGEYVTELENIASSLLPGIRGQKSGAIKVRDANAGSICDLIRNLSNVFAR